MDRKKFYGAFTALITPFTSNGIDEAAYKKLIDWQIAQSIHGLVPCGTTGESPTLSEKEHAHVIELCVRAVNKRVPIIAGAGSNSTSEAIHMTKHAAKVGADAVLVVTPYYNKPTNKGIYLHYKAISESADIPIILYNIAGRTGRNIEPDLMAKLAGIKNIIGVKEASGNLEQMKKIRELCPKDFLLISGDDALTLPILSMGGVGIISVASNIVPKDVAELVNVFNKGDKAGAQAINAKLLPLIEALFIETNPIPVKTAASLMGLCSAAMRLPMCEMEDANLAKLKQALKSYGVPKMIKLAISGCQGRMGQRITAFALKDKVFKISALLENKDRPDVPLLSHNIPVNFEDAALKGSDVLIEFTTPEATIAHLKSCQKYGVNMVIGTTGFTKAQIAQIKKASSRIGVVFSSNMSVGVNLMFGLIRQAAQITGKDYSIYLTETHHMHKKDAPSGTAKTMAELAAQYSKTNVTDIASLRQGEVIGDHTITFESPVDLISIHHHAKTRDIFAEGSLVAAKFLSKKKKGLFNMQDVLGL